MGFSVCPEGQKVPNGRGVSKDRVFGYVVVFQADDLSKCRRGLDISHAHFRLCRPESHRGFTKSIHGKWKGKGVGCIVGRRLKVEGKHAAKWSNQASPSQRELKLYTSLILIRTSQPFFSLDGTWGIIYFFRSQCCSRT